MKIAVYGISKNEEKYIRDWIISAQKADGIFLLDTGSTDKTLEIAKEFQDQGYINLEINQEIISPWRFDIARNKSLAMIPEGYDIAICLDLDEQLVPGWRGIVEKNWKQGLDRLRYKYVWSWTESGEPDLIYHADKIHSLKSGFKWIHPVHEVLDCDKDGYEYQYFIDDILIEHYPDNSKPRSQYLPLLELAVKERPDDQRNLHYLGREYFYYKMYNEAIHTLLKHAAISTWPEEKSFSLRYISMCYWFLGNIQEAFKYGIASCYTSNLRETWIWVCEMFFSQKNWQGLIWAASELLKIDINTTNYFNERKCRNHHVFDLLSVAYAEMGRTEMAIDSLKTAIEKCDCENDLVRLKKNLEWLCTN